ncbi:MAG: response regulator [Anaerolineae bacterium]
MHLLLIEDSGTLANLFRAQARRLGNHSVTIAATKTKAIAAFQKEKFDIVFIDMGLEGIQDRGLQVLQEIKALAPAQKTGILSSNDLKNMVKASQENGAEFYMVKPFTYSGLKVVLEGDREAIEHYQPDISEGRIIVL